MKRMSTAWLVGAGILFLFGLLGGWLPGLIGLPARAAWILRAVLWLLGAAAAGLVFLYLRARAKSMPQAAAHDDEVDAAFGTARKRLKGKTKIGRAPVVLVLGPAGSAKTTVITRSGVEPELIAGEVLRGETIVPTSAVNLWYASGTIVAEAGGRVSADVPRWGRLLRQLQPSRLAAVFARGRQAPRLAVVCFSCEEFMKPGSGEAVPAAAQTLRARLTDIANQFGVRLPVYVMFTKADRLPYFTDYVRSFTREEAAEVLGATLPLAEAVDSGRHKERETARLDQAFGRLLHHVGLRRLDILPRETAEDVRAGAYEFPRELRKISGLAIQFLVELCRPAQIGSAPFLRGFYFTGVRPLVVNDSPQAVPTPSLASGAAVDATAVFDVRSIAAAAQASAPVPGSRRVPDWTFLSRVFREIVLADTVAMSVTGGGARVNLLRRGLLIAATVAFLLLGGAFFVSFLSNRGLIDEARAATAAVQGVDLAGVGIPPAEDLARLDTLRVLGAQLRAWDTDKPPLRYRWGLYAGDELLPEMRHLYFQRFGRMLWSGTRQSLVSALGALPDTPTSASDYNTTFDGLKAYIITTDHPEYSTVEFLSPVALRYWRGERDVEVERSELATRQFDFFATELPYGNPFQADVDAGLVSRTRRYLAQFGDADRLYQALLNEASRNAPAVAYQRDVPGSETVIRNDLVVPGAFTTPGWAFVQANVENVDRFFASDAWVLGEQTVSAADRARIGLDLRRRYVQDYITMWTQYLTGSTVLAYSGAQDAARKLGRLSDNQSPLLQLFAIASRHTAVDTAAVGRAFQPVHGVVPPDVSDRFIGPGNEQYMAGLSDLYRTMEQVATAQGAERNMLLTQAQGGADRVSGTARQMAQSFAVEGDARAVGVAVQRLLQQPVERLAPVVAGLPAAEVNGKSAAFCSVVAPVLRKFPFSPGATAEASVDEVNAALQPGGSALTTLLEGLQDLIVRQGSQYVPRPDAQPRPNADFLVMVNRLVQISESLYDRTGAGPRVDFVLAPQATEALPEVVVTINRDNVTVTRTNAGSRSFQWDANNASEARIAARVGTGGLNSLVGYQGTWAVFRLFGQAQWQPVSATSYRLTWNVAQPATTLTAELRFVNRTPIFDPAFMGGVSCVARVAR
jgi:type VI secretion system protein ImpL